MKQFLIMLTFLASGSFLFAQNPENGKIRIKVDANVDGEKVKIDTSLDALSDFDLNGLLKELGLDEELSQLNIDINSGFNFDFEFDDAALKEMMLELNNIEMPVMPNLEALNELKFTPQNKAFLGVYTDKVDQGAKITDLVDESAAIAAGLKVGDIITAIDARTIESPANLSEVIGMYEPGTEVKITYLRDGSSRTMKVTLRENKNTYYNWSGIEMPDSFNFKWDDAALENLMEMNKPTRGYLGVFLQDEEGKVKITGVEDNSAAKEAGLQANDVIKSVNGKTISTYNELIEFMQETKPGDKISITYLRESKEYSIDVILKEVKNNMYYFNNSDKEEGFAPNIIIDKIAPFPPGSAYSYKSGDGKKNITVCITAIKQSDVNTAAPELRSPESNHTLLNVNSVSVYSNPSTGAFNVKFELPETGDTKIVITDINGKEVYSELLMNFSGAFDKTIALSNEPKGTYFVKVSQNGYSNTKTVILQ